MTDITDNTEGTVEISTSPQSQQNFVVRPSLYDLAISFGKLGVIAFGGPAAHIAQIEREVVQRKHWITREQLLDMLGVANLIPGPNSTELTIHIGLEKRGWQGAIVSGICFIMPAMLLVWGFAFIYVQYQTIPTVGWLLYGVKPVIIAIIAQSLWKLGKSALKTVPTWTAGLLVLLLYFLKINEVLLMLAAGVAVSVACNLSKLRSTSWSGFFVPISVGAIAVEIQPKTWFTVFLIFLKIGAVMYGGGYVLLAFVQQEFVERLGWLTSQQLLDAVAIGQFTPGPLFTTATFIGYLIAGNLGAIAGTLGIFLPAFILVPLVYPFVAKIRKSPWAAGFLDGVNASAIGLMVAVALELGRVSVIDLWTSFLAIASCGILCKFPTLNSAWLVLAGAVLGWLLKVF